MELLLSITKAFPDALWEQFQSSIQVVHTFTEPRAVFQYTLISSVDVWCVGGWVDITVSWCCGRHVNHFLSCIDP